MQRNFLKESRQLRSPATRARPSPQPGLHLVANRAELLGRQRSPLALWHLLSLDAPTVAATWTIFVGWCGGVRLSLVDPIAMFLAVWMLYATDRLLDARPLAGGSAPLELEERHRFHDRHRRAFVRTLATATLLLAFLLHRLVTPVLHLYALLAALLMGWLLLVHARPSAAADAHRLPKELAVGVFFPAAVFIPTVARVPGLRTSLLPDALLFAAVCSLNCLFLYAWEHPIDDSRAHVTTRWALRRLEPLGWAVLAAALAVGFADVRAGAPDPARALGLPVCCGMSAALLLLLHRFRRKVMPVHLRAMADLVLLTPLPFLLVVSLGRAR